MNIGKVVQVVGPVVDVEFPDALPSIYNALTVDYTVENQPVSPNRSRRMPITSRALAIPVATAR